MCPSKSFSHCFIPLPLAPIASIEVIDEVFRRLDYIVSTFVAVPTYDIPTVMALTNVMHNAINSIFPFCISLFVCSSSSFPCVDIFFFHVYWLVPFVLIMMLCVFCQWHLGSLVEQYWYVGLCFSLS